MTVETLRTIINERARDLRIKALLTAGVIYHQSGQGWRDCPCSWCEKKREATFVIGSQVPHMWRQAGQYVDDLRHIWREEQRIKYRSALRSLEKE